MTQSLQLRPELELQQLGKEIPGLWAQVEIVHRIGQAPGPFHFPSWCYLPIQGAYAAAQKALSNKGHASHMHAATSMARIVALAPWRMTKGVYRFNPDLMEDVSQSMFGSVAPTNLLINLVEWCCYCETPGMDWFGMKLFGFWVHLECDHKNKRRELRFLLDTEAGLFAHPVHLGPWNLAEGLRRANDESVANGLPLPGIVREDYCKLMVLSMLPLVNMTLFISSTNSKFTSNKPDLQPGNPQYKSVKGGQKMFPRDGVIVWNVGSCPNTPGKSTQAEEAHA